MGRPRMSQCLEPNPGWFSWIKLPSKCKIRESFHAQKKPALWYHCLPIASNLRYFNGYHQRLINSKSTSSQPTSFWSSFTLSLDWAISSWALASYSPPAGERREQAHWGPYVSCLTLKKSPSWGKKWHCCVSVDKQWWINDRLSIANRSLKVLWIAHRPSHSRITQQQTVVCVCPGHSTVNTSRTIATIALLFDLAEYNEETRTGFQR